MKNPSFDFIINSINAWQQRKQDKKFITELLHNSYAFEITLPKKRDEKFYHFYLGLDLYPYLRNEKEEKPQLYMHIVPASADTMQNIKKNKETLAYWMTSNKIETKFNCTNTKISDEEALKRIEAWTTIDAWISYNQVFNGFQIPAEDLDSTKLPTTLMGYFAIKEEKGLVVPDIVISRITGDTTLEYYDMARLCPPFKTQVDRNSFGLLDFIYVDKSF